MSEAIKFLAQISGNIQMLSIIFMLNNNNVAG